MTPACFKYSVVIMRSDDQIEIKICGHKNGRLPTGDLWGRARTKSSPRVGQRQSTTALHRSPYSLFEARSRSRRQNHFAKLRPRKPNVPALSCLALRIAKRRPQSQISYCAASFDWGPCTEINLLRSAITFPLSLSVSLSRRPVVLEYAPGRFLCIASAAAYLCAFRVARSGSVYPSLI